ncbi:hypothetical protein ACLB2K_071128 [Fragaria x ananassa]
MPNQQKQRKGRRSLAQVSYYCSACKALFFVSKEQHDVLAHSRYATAGKPYKCVLCKKTSPSFRSADALTKHQAAVHHVVTYSAFHFPITYLTYSFTSTGNHELTGTGEDSQDTTSTAGPDISVGFLFSFKTNI